MTDEQPPAKPLSVPERILASRPLAELLALDWTRTNVAIGSLLGLSPYRTRRLRLALRKAGYPVPKARCGAPKGSERWRETRDTYLKAGIGKVTDRALAETLGVTKQAVHHMRRVMGIPAPTEATRADKESRRRTALAVLAKRIETCARKGLSRHATAKKLGVGPDRVQQAVRLFRIPAAQPRHRDYSGVDWTRTNAEIAQDLGIKRESVVSARRQLRLRGHAIPRAPYPHARRTPSVDRKRTYRSRKKYLKEGIGKLSDRVVAEKMGVTPSAVCHMRAVMGIPLPHVRRKA